MPTSLKVDERLVAEAVKAGGHKSPQDAINAAMTEYIERHNRLRILELAGKIDFDSSWDYKKMRRGKS